MVYRGFFFFFFFSSRRRHTRSLCDWSSDVCSSDLLMGDGVSVAGPVDSDVMAQLSADMVKNKIRSEERREGKSVDLGGRRIIKKKKKKINRSIYNKDSSATKK